MKGAGDIGGVYFFTTSGSISISAMSQYVSSETVWHTRSRERRALICELYTLHLFAVRL